LDLPAAISCAVVSAFVGIIVLLERNKTRQRHPYFTKSLFCEIRLWISAFISIG
jgi:hypothetical protein